MVDATFRPVHASYLWKPAVWIACGVCLLFSTPRGPAAEPPLQSLFEQRVGPLLKEHCAGCHSEAEPTSGVRVDHLTAYIEDRQVALWANMRRQIDRSTMPPEEEPPLPEDARLELLTWIDQGLDEVRRRPAPKNGSIRRLTREQYGNTLQELLGLQENLIAILPAEAVSRDGFTNQQATLQSSPMLIESYFSIARRALELAVIDPAAPPVIQNFRMRLGRGINRQPCPDELVLGALSLLLNNEDFVVEDLIADKSFEFTPFHMRTNYRFQEGYQGNDTVRGWREYDSIYHAVFACMRGTLGYPQGEAHSLVENGLLLRPAIPSAEVFEVESTYGPSANFKISLRELPDQGNFRITVTAAKYDDGLLLDADDAPRDADAAAAIGVEPSSANSSIHIPEAGIYQIDAYPRPQTEQASTGEASQPWSDKATSTTPDLLTIGLGAREFSGQLHHPGFLVVRLEQGSLPIEVNYASAAGISRLVFTPLADSDPLVARFLAFEQRQPRLGVHLGLRRDCGSTLTRVGSIQTVHGTEEDRYVFEGAITNFPAPDVQADNDNYLAGIREIGIRSEYTDGREMPRLRIREVEFEGPFYEQWPPASHRAVFIDSGQAPDSRDYATEIITNFANKAFRRPVTSQEVATFLQIFDEQRFAGASFRQAITTVLEVVLTSPQFLFLVEDSRSPQAEPLDDYELASKLSYFLWNGPPDAALLQQAAAGTLHRRLDAELSRLLADPRHLRFTEQFVRQWLALDKFQVLEPDRERYPHLTRHARSELAREPIALFEHVLEHNLPLTDWLDADYVMANEVVAHYYGLGTQTEQGFKFVSIPHQRADLGGVLSQAAMLAGLSDGREGNPIKRGAWLARKIIGEPPEDPPPNVPALQESGELLSLRQRLEAHRNQPGCQECHTKIDPWGLALEQYDASGLFRVDEQVDASSILPDGTAVAGIVELKRYLVEDRLDQVAFSLARHMLVYATGREPAFSELELLREELLSLKPQGYPVQSVLRLVVRSPMFVEK